MVRQMNRWILSLVGFVGSSDELWSDLTGITVILIRIIAMEPTLYFQVHDKIAYQLKYMYMEWNILWTADKDMKENIIFIGKEIKFLLTFN